MTWSLAEPLQLPSQFAAAGGTAGSAELGCRLHGRRLARQVHPLHSALSAGACVQLQLLPGRPVHLMLFCLAGLALCHAGHMTRSKPHETSG
jgi:hypothetical protein